MDYIPGRLNPILERNSSFCRSESSFVHDCSSFDVLFLDIFLFNKASRMAFTGNQQTVVDPAVHGTFAYFKAVQGIFPVVILGHVVIMCQQWAGTRK